MMARDRCCRFWHPVAVKEGNADAERGTARPGARAAAAGECGRAEPAVRTREVGREGWIWEVSLAVLGLLGFVRSRRVGPFGVQGV